MYLADTIAEIALLALNHDDRIIPLVRFLCPPGGLCLSLFHCFKLSIYEHKFLLSIFFGLFKQHLGWLRPSSALYLFVCLYLCIALVPRAFHCFSCCVSLFCYIYKWFRESSSHTRTAVATICNCRRSFAVLAFSELSFQLLPSQSASQASQCLHTLKNFLLVVNKPSSICVILLISG